MPGAAVPTIGNFLLAVFGGTSAAATAAAYFAAEVFAYAATSYLLARASAALAPKPNMPAGLPGGMEANYFDTSAAVRVIYGRVKVGGMETIPPLTNSKPNSNAFEDLHKVLTIAGHEINSYEYTHFDATTIVNAQIGPVAYTMSDGLVNSGTFKDLAFIRRYLGTSTDSADRILVSNNTVQFGNARARGIAKARLTFRYDADVYKNIPAVTFTLQGKKCYDPRLDSSPGAAPTNPSFIAWTENPALCLADYLLSGLGGEYDPADIDWDTVVTAANACDALVNIPNSLTRKRYTCNGVLLTTDDFLDNVKLLADSMLGRVIFRDGKWRLFAGGWQTPTFTIAKSDWISPMNARFEQGSKKRFNQARVWYIDPNREWQKNECIPRLNATYRTADGGRLFEAETEQLMCTNEYEAQMKGEFLLRQSRNQVAPTGQLGPKHGNIALWDTGTIVDDELGFSSKTFRVVAVDRSQDGRADYVFNEEQSTDWTDLAAAEYNQPSNAPIPANNVTTPTEPLGFAAVPQINGTILFSWSPPIVRPPGTRFRIVRSTNSADASVGTAVWDGVDNPVPLVMPVSKHWYYVYALTSSGAKSVYSPNTFGIEAIPRVEADNTLSNRIAGDAEFSFGAAASMWQVGNVFSVSSGFTGAAIEQFNNVASLGVTSYSQTGGQYGGYLNFQKRNGVTHVQGQDFPAFFTANPQNSLGIPSGVAPYAVQYTMRFRVNSRPNGGPAGEQFVVAVGRRFSTPASAYPSQVMFVSGVLSVQSVDAPLGQWTYMRRIKVVEPLDIFANSINQAYDCGVVYSGCNSGINVDFDLLAIDNIGWTNYPVDVSTGGPLREYHSMFQSVPDIDCQFSFGNDSFGTVGFWPRFVPGRRFVINKTSTTSACFITPSSGMTLRLAGRAATGTITMVQSLPATAIIENVDGINYLVTGVGLQ